MRPAVAVRAKVERATGGVNLPLALLLVIAASACTRTTRPAPVDQGVQPWTTTMADARRDGGADQAAPRDPAEAWRVDIGRGLTAPLALRSDLLAVTSVDRRVIVMSAASGEIYWEKRLSGVASGSAVFDGAIVYVGAQADDGAAHAFEMARGFELWKRDMPMPVGAALLEGGDNVWSTDNGTLVALDAEGAVRWRGRLAGALVHTPVPSPRGLLVSTSADTLYRIDRASGAVLDRLPLPASVSATPALAGQRLILPLFDTTVVTVDVADWRLAASTRPGAQVRAAPVIDADDAAWLLTETAELWHWPAEGAPRRVAQAGGSARRSLALSRDGVLVGRLDGRLSLYDFAGGERWTRDLEDSIEAPALVHAGAVYVPLLRGDLVKLTDAAP